MKNMLIVWASFALLALVAYAAYSNYHDAAPQYHLVVNCGEMGQFEVEPGDMRVAPDGSGTIIAKMTNGNFVKFPPYCTIEAKNTPIEGDTDARPSGNADDKDAKLEGLDLQAEEAVI